MKNVCGKVLFGFVLSLALTLGFSSVQAQAAPKLNRKSATITVGKTVKLKVKGTKKKVKWSSTKKSVCTVSKSGLVKGKKAGTAVIKAKVAKKTLKCTVKVKAKKKPTPSPAPTPTPVVVKPSGITVTGAFSKIAPGGTIQLQMAFVPANATPEPVKWYTSSSSRATVSNTGLVVAKNTGEVTITAELESNYRIKGSFKLNIENLAVKGEVTTGDGGDLLLSENASKAIYTYSLSYAVGNVTTQVIDGLGNVIRSYPMGAMGANIPRSVTWDLRNENGHKVSEGTYCFQVVAAGTVIKSQHFKVFANSEFGKGNGSPSSPYEVSTLEQLKMIIGHNGACFIQTEDIDVNYGKITPMFTTDEPFTGTYDGNNHIISNLNNMMEGVNNIGLFTAVGEKGEIRNVVVDRSNFNGNNNIAALVGVNEGTIADCVVKNSTFAAADGWAASIVASNSGMVRGCRSEENNVTSTAYGANAGTICGYNNGTILESSSTSNSVALIPKGYNDSFAGGIVAKNEGNVIDCTAQSAALSATGHYPHGGGIAGYNGGTVTGCKVMELTVDGEWHAKGGVIGYNRGINNNNIYDGTLEQVGRK